MKESMFKDQFPFLDNLQLPRQASLIGRISQMISRTLSILLMSTSTNSYDGYDIGRASTL